ncbi:penicillin-binding protein 1C [Phragmitibacter flavus]|uniref:peptidoglycan glycosyltransferase n=1 Tax=Phragmitibacter flavus TaxID=2576071 RepID=A0A5R8KI16_9BACT|nr:penicillin-binding protein 1C [Phragmitibacter flavus]TLD71922.1 penicillin-binding protein 1C [Phragmitibacter flavus]
MPSRPVIPKLTRARALFFIALLLPLAAWYLLPLAIPLPKTLLAPQPLSPTYFASDGKPLRQLLAADGQRITTPVTYTDLPEPLIHALLAAEDQRFFSHGGIDLLAILRAAKDNLSQNRITSGASTLTQQLIKTTSPKAPRTYLQKIREALQARHLELTWSKQDILTAYFNRVSFGNLLTGIHSAAESYLNKPLRDLTPAECAFLAALPQSPTRLNPHRNLPAVQARQKRILCLMHQHGWLTEEALHLAQNEPLTLHRHSAHFSAPHATSLISNLKSEISNSIPTTIDRSLQQKVETTLTQHLNRLTHKNVTQAAAVIIENQTGHVLALAGSRDFFNSPDGQINGAWSPHSPGSALKPFTYLLALENGFTPATIIPDLPIEYATETGLYRPENYDRKNHGPVTLRHALGNSLNIPAVRLLQQIGGESILYTTLQNLGLTTLTEKPSHYGLGLTIGNAPVRLLELTNAYATLARLGQHQPWTLTPNPNSNLKSQISLRGSAANPEACFLIADILADNNARQQTFGPRSVIRLPFPCAVKTGTSTDYRDNWTLGFTPEYTVGVWAGNFDNTPMNQVSGVTGAGPIFRDLFLHLHRTRGTTWFTTPSELLTHTIDPRNGKIIPSNLTPSLTQQELFLPKTLPPTATAADYESTTNRAYLSPEYTAWLQTTDTWQRDLLAIRPNLNPPPRILTPTNGSTFVLDPDLPDQGRQLLLRSNQQTPTWTSPTLKITQTPNGLTHAHLEPGTHTLTLHLPDSDLTATTQIHVRPAQQKRTP